MDRIITLSMAVLMTIGGTGVAFSETAKQSGNEYTWQNVQHYRQKYDAFKAHAAAAAGHSDYVNAAKSATEAFSNVPNGYDVTFTPSQIGVQVKVAIGYRVVGQTSLSAPQLVQFLRGPSAQFDALMAKGGGNVLSALPGGYTYADGRPSMPPQAQQARPTRPGMDLSTPEGIEAAAYKLYPWAGDGDKRRAFIIDKLSEQLDRQQGNSYSIRIKR